MRCCTSVLDGQPRRALAWRCLWLLAICCALCLPGMAARAADPARAHIELTELQVERADDGLYLSARLRFDLPAAVEDALHKGIAVHFVAEAQVMRSRWYWYDRKMASAQRYMRVAYQPLTNRWRLNTSSEPLTGPGLGMSLTQYYDTLAETMAAVQRLSRWRIARAAELESGGQQTMNFRFRLDASQLPRTLQIGAIGDSDWALSLERSIDLTQEAGQ